MSTQEINEKLKRITRYNQGFGMFGPLEQANDGKLVKFSDLIDLYVDIADQNSIYSLKIYSANKLSREQLKEIDNLKTRLSTAMNKNFKLEDEYTKTATQLKRATIWRDTFFQLWMVTIITAVLLHFNGGI